MSDHDKAAARREIADALLTALARRHALLDAIVEADSRPAAIILSDRCLQVAEPYAAHG
jgi:hypothetical protein